MCIIIQRNPGFVIPKEKFLSAVKVNPHGYGIAAAEGDGVLTVVREVPEEVDAEALYDMIHGEFANDQLLIHLRYNTVGETTLRNAHPFPILEYETDGVDLRMAHNGTIGKFKPGVTASNKWESDTRVFVRTYVRPLFKRMAKALGPENVMKDSFVERLLDDQITSSSVLSFIDGFGNTLNVNALGNGGAYEDEWYYSNKYSFNKSHREPTRNVYAPGYSYHNDTDWWETYNSEYKTTQKTSNVTQFDKKDHALDSKTELFTDKYNVDDLEDLFGLGDDFLDALFDEEPDDAKLLCKEMLAAAQVYLNKSQSQEKQIKKMGEIIEKLRNGKGDDSAAA